VIRTIALAYSGGLDTSIIVPWLKERYGARVICVAADIGQGEELEGVRAKAIASGADECYVEDLRQEFVEKFVWPTLRAGAIYGRKYLLGTSMGRPLIARRQVEIARQVGADALTVVPARATTRSDSSLRMRRLLRIFRSSRRGASGTFGVVRMRLPTLNHIVSR